MKRMRLFVSLHYILSAMLILMFAERSLSGQEWLSGPWSQGLFGDLGVGGSFGPFEVNFMVEFDDDGDGELSLFVAGNFQKAGGDPVDNIAKWEDRRWQPPLGGGLQGEVNGLVVFTPSAGPLMGTPLLVVGGLFPLAGGGHAERVSYWTGTAWTALSPGGPNFFPVSAIYAAPPPPAGSGLLYVAENYFPAFFSTNLWSFDGATWTLEGTTGSPVNGRINAIYEFEGSVYIGGDFDTVDRDGGGPIAPVAAVRLARLTGGTWSSAGGIFDTPVLTITSFDDGMIGPTLYVGGNFMNPYPPLFVIVGVQRMNPPLSGTWEVVAGGLRGAVRALYPWVEAPGGPLLIAGGDFSLDPGGDTSRIAAFDGAAWGPLSDSLQTGSVRSIQAHTDTPMIDGTPVEFHELYAGGTFNTNGQGQFPTQLGHIARLSNNVWRALGGGFGNQGTSATERVRALVGAEPPDSPERVLYAGGDFEFAGGVHVNQVARWKEGQWETMGDGTIGGNVSSMVMHDDGFGLQLYAAGLFTVMDGVPAEKIARWDEATLTWSPVGAGLFGVGTPISLAVHDADDGFGKNLYMAGGIGACRRWDGFVWITLPNIPLAPPYQLKVVGTPGSEVLLCAGGTQDERMVVRWTGAGWAGVGRATNGPTCVEAFDPIGPPLSFCRLYAGGSIIQSGPDFSGSFSRFNGFTWEDPGHNILGTVRNLLSVNADGFPYLVLAGAFNDGFVDPPASNVLLWNGFAWSSLAGGVSQGSDGADFITLFNDGISVDGLPSVAHVYIAGSNTVAGNANSRGIARFRFDAEEVLPAACDPLIIPEGDTVEVPLIIFVGDTVTGTTENYNDDYDHACPDADSTASDVVYQLELGVATIIDIALCTSDFDTKVYVYSEVPVVNPPLACNDDGCGADGLKSSLSGLTLNAGTYYIVIDGKGDESGNYTLSVMETQLTLSWNPGVQASRSLSIAASFATATGGAGTAAIRVRPVDLQNPNPPNAPCCPPQNFGAYESATCTAVGETNGCARWVGPVVTIPEAQDNPGLGNYRAARLQCAPYYTDWTTVGTFVVVGPEIMPSSMYELTAFGASCKGVEGGCTSVSSPVQAATRRSGDIASPYSPLGVQPDPQDVVASVNKFKNLAGSPSKAVAQIQPNVLELNTDASALDIVAVVDAFRGTAYPYQGPCPCPSSFVCNAVPCSSSFQCPGGSCVRTCVAGAHIGQPCLNNNHCPGSTCGTGFCRDRCARCQ